MISIRATNKLSVVNVALLCLLAGSLTVNAASDNKAVDSAQPPTTFDNPIIKYDTEDPTNKAGDIIYTADPAVEAAEKLQKIGVF